MLAPVSFRSLDSSFITVFCKSPVPAMINSTSFISLMIIGIEAKNSSIPFSLEMRPIKPITFRLSLIFIFIEYKEVFILFYSLSLF